MAERLYGWEPTLVWSVSTDECRECRALRWRRTEITSVQVAKRLYGGMPRMPGAKMVAPEIAEGLDGEC